MPVAKVSKKETANREKALEELMELVCSGEKAHGTASNPDYESGYRAGYAKALSGAEIERRLPAIRKTLNVR